MSASLRVGDPAQIEIDGRTSIHCIVARKTTALTRSGVAYRLLPAVEGDWIDADLVKAPKGFGNRADRGVDPRERGWLQSEMRDAGE